MRGGRVLSGRRPSFHPHVHLRDMVFVKNNYSPTADLLRQSFKLLSLLQIKIWLEFCLK